MDRQSQQKFKKSTKEERWKECGVREREKERERRRERERKVVFYFSFLMFMICCLIYKLWSKREKKGECVHANPRRETAFYSPSTQKATLCLLSYIALLGSFLALLSLSLSLHSVITFCLNPILFPTTHFDHILSLSPPKTQKHKYTILVYLVYDYDNLYCSCIPWVWLWSISCFSWWVLLICLFESIANYMRYDWRIKLFFHLVCG